MVSSRTDDRCSGLAVSSAVTAEPPSRVPRRVYGAPRVFDLFTLCAVTLAFAVLFAALQLLDRLADGAATVVSVIICLFVSGIGLAQVLLFGGRRPRLASIVGGIGLMSLLLAVTWLVDVEGGRRAVRWLGIPSVVAYCLIQGMIFGYLAGGAVAGVFLIADVFRRRFLPPADGLASQTHGHPLDD